MEQELLAFAKEWDKAMEQNNADEIGSYMHDNWICVGSDGRTTKAAFLASITSGDLTHHTMTTEKPQVKIYGDTGIITSTGVSAGEYKGTVFHLDEWQSSIFIKENGKWSCVLTMLTPANTKE